MGLEKGIVDFGNSYVVKKVAEDQGFQDVLKSSYEDFDTIMALICYQMNEGSDMYNAQEWIEGNIANMLFPKAKLRSQDISRLINYLGREDVQSKFFRSYIEKLAKGLIKFKRRPVKSSECLPNHPSFSRSRIL